MELQDQNVQEADESRQICRMEPQVVEPFSFKNLLDRFYLNNYLPDDESSSEAPILPFVSLD